MSDNRWTKPYNLGAFVLLLVGCTIWDVEFVNQRPMHPIPDVYPTWYAEIEECVGWSGPGYHRLRFFVADEIVKEHSSDLILGTILDHEVTILAGEEETKFIVVHEFAHHVSGQGNEMHYNDALRERCWI